MVPLHVAARGKRMTAKISRWRSSEIYDYLDDLDSPDLAWEWLRRNMDYQKDYARADSPSLKRELRRKWGLQFFRPAVGECWRASRDLVRGGGHQHRVAHPNAHRSTGGRQSLLRAA
ncbi:MULTISPECIES: transcriptional regulator domain-containing protein [unclassified Agrobacterium]